MGLLTLHELAFFGQGDTQCGTQPTLSVGEQATCCPGAGWVIYDMAESPTGICERASGSVAPATTLPSAPLERVEALRQQIEARREAFETKRHQDMLEQLQLRMVAGRVEGQQRAIAARSQAQADAETAKLRAASAVRTAKEQQETQKKLLGIGAALLAAYLVFSR